jgi:hypothetical protein
MAYKKLKIHSVTHKPRAALRCEVIHEHVTQAGGLSGAHSRYYQLKCMTQAISKVVYMTTERSPRVPRHEVAQRGVIGEGCPTVLNAF